jgi:2-polyprenyl-3-methyl-5-hydroxy-6-metoxy-1,4-benzoquinol methylase
MASTNGISSKAQAGFAKGAAYDRNRPGYTHTIVQHLLESLHVSGKKHARILDLAAGTGKLTEAIAARDEQYEIIAVEPHDEMRQVLEDKKLPGVTVLAGKADAIPVGDEEFDAVVCAQVGNSSSHFDHFFTSRIHHCRPLRIFELSSSIGFPLVRKHDHSARDPSYIEGSWLIRYGVERR